MVSVYPRHSVDRHIMFQRLVGLSDNAKVKYRSPTFAIKAAMHGPDRLFHDFTVFTFHRHLSVAVTPRSPAAQFVHCFRSRRRHCLDK